MPKITQIEAARKDMLIWEAKEWLKRIHVILPIGQRRSITDPNLHGIKALGDWINMRQDLSFLLI